MGAPTNPMSGHGMKPAADNVDHEASQLRANIAQTRAEMSGTIEELHGRLNPTLLKEQALEQFHDAKETLKAELQEAKAAIKAEVKAELQEVKASVREEFVAAKAAVREATIGKVENMVHSAENTVRETSHSIVDTIKQNPIPAALAGIGLAWLFMNARSASSRRDRSRADQIGVRSFDHHGNVIDTAVRRVGDAAGKAAHSIQHAVGSVAQQAGHLAHDATAAIGDAAHGAGEAIGHFAHDAQSSVGQLAHDAAVQAQRMERGVEHTFNANPLAVGAAVLAVGTAIGLAIPSTRQEDELMGQVRDQVMGKARAFAHDALGKVEEAATHITDDAARAMKDGNTTQKMPAAPRAS